MIVSRISKLLMMVVMVRMEFVVVVIMFKYDGVVILEYEFELVKDIFFL